MDFGDVLWRDKNGWINGIVETGTSTLLMSQTVHAVGIYAQLSHPETREPTPESILVRMSLLDAWKLAHQILETAHQQGWGFPDVT